MLTDINTTGPAPCGALTPGLEVLAKGQRVMTLFELVGFEPDRSLTIVNRSRDGARRLFGEVWVSGVTRPGQRTDCRLLAKLLVRFPATFTESVLRRVLPLGDLVMRNETPEEPADHGGACSCPRRPVVLGSGRGQGSPPLDRHAPRPAAARRRQPLDRGLPRRGGERAVADGAALRRHLERLAARPCLVRIIPSHGPILETDPAGVLLRAARRIPG